MVPGAPAITELMLYMKNASEESVFDRSYSIRNSETQVTVLKLRNFVIEGMACQPPSSLRRLQATPPLQTSLVKTAF